MNSKKRHKLSKATVATVVAASGVVIALPHSTQAYMFSDLNPQADYYQPIVDLYNKNIAIGYTDGKFKPNQAITRGEAAEMLALAIGINTRNVSNPMFSDVSVSNKYYKYIAALANEGIINGFQDRTFRLNQPITRGQMAKMITLGYKLGVSSKLNHGFKDVSGQNGNAYFIQTLFDLKITKGKTPVAFEPFSSVTRGQMATFVWRAGQADAGDPVYNIGDITGEKMYINGVAYTIAPSLRSLFNTSNKRILKDAAVEGTFSGTTLTSVSKLTINASGTSSSLLALDGDFTSFNGQLVINGSYLRLKNWTLTGKVTIAETPRRSLAHADITTKASIFNTRIASLNGFGFINWDKPTDSIDETPNSTVNETLKPKPTNTNKYTPYNLRMPKIDRYVDFSNSIISNLHIEQSNTFISAEETINRLTVARDVANFELYADANALYIDTDVNLTMYGVNDIRYVYKNSSKNVNFYTDSYYDFLYVSNGSGWIDLGEHVYIKEVILPKKKTPNDIFIDYKNDNGNIGHIEDKDGNAVDRDPVENSIIPDATAPSITRLAVEPGGTTATVRLTADEDGTYYYLVLEKSQRAPSISEIKALGGQYSGKGSLTMDEEVQFTVTRLEQLTDYVIYVVVIDDAENVSDREDAAFSTKDGTPPSIRQLKAEAMNGGKRARISFKPTELGAYGYLIVGADAPAPTADEVWSKGKRTVLKNADLDGVEFIDNTLSPNTSYVVYMVMDDVSGNRSALVKSNTFSTGDLDMTPPEVVSMTVTEMLKDPTKVLITFNEKMDKATAENIANYELGGTGNLTGQPFKATLSKDGKGVTLEIPSMAAFVINDTLTVKISKVQDEAGNEIVETTETYKHRQGDKSDPKISGIKVNVVGPELSTQSVREATFTSNLAGSYYYLVVPIDPSGQRKDPERSDIFFPKEYIDKYKDDPALKIHYYKADRGETLEGPLLTTTGPIKLDIVDSKFLAHPYGYKIFIAMQDRNGKFAEEILSEVFIGDMGAPIITNWYANSLDVNGDLRKNEPETPFKYEEGKPFEYFIEFNEPMSKSSVESAANYEVRKYVNSSDITGILVQPTIMYTETKDVSGKWIYRAKISVPSDRTTIEGVKYSVKLNGVKDQGGTNAIAENTVKTFIYEDLVQPRVKNKIMYRVDDHTAAGKAVVELTFDEALDPTTITANNFVLSAKSGTTAVSPLNTTISAVELTGENNNIVKLTLTNAVDKYEYTVTVKDNGVTDTATAKNTIDLAHNKAVYIYRAFKFRFANLQPDPTTLKDAILTTDGSLIKVATKMKVRVDNDMLHINESTPYDPEDIKYYYVVLSGPTIKPTFEQIVKPTVAISYGSGPIERTQAFDIPFELAAGFMPGDKIYLVVGDKYGNKSQIEEYIITRLNP